MPVCASLSGYGDDNVVSESDEIARESDAGLYSATLPILFDYGNNQDKRRDCQHDRVSSSRISEAISSVWCTILL